MSEEATVVQQKPFSIDFVLSGDPLDNAMRAAVLRGSSNYIAQISADVITTASIQGLGPGRYRAENREDKWYFTPQPQPSYPSH